MEEYAQTRKECQGESAKAALDTILDSAEREVRSGRMNTAERCALISALGVFREGKLQTISKFQKKSRLKRSTEYRRKHPQ